MRIAQRFQRWESERRIGSPRGTTEFRNRLATPVQSTVVLQPRRGERTNYRQFHFSRSCEKVDVYELAHDTRAHRVSKDVTQRRSHR